jgi:hypothetical protein
MRQSRFSEEKIIAVPAEQERGMGTADVLPQAWDQPWDILQTELVAGLTLPYTNDHSS